MQQFFPQARVRVIPDPDNIKSGRKTKIVHVGKDGSETDISDACQEVVITLSVRGIPKAQLICNAELTGAGNFLIDEPTDLTLEEYFKRAHATGVIDHALRASIDERGRVSFYIHPANADGDTRDYEVRHNLTRPDPRVTRAGD